MLLLEAGSQGKSGFYPKALPPFRLIIILRGSIPNPIPLYEKHFTPSAGFLCNVRGGNHGSVSIRCGFAAGTRATRRQAAKTGRY
jgi:hypothetical protein